MTSPQARRQLWLMAGYLPPVALLEGGERGFADDSVDGPIDVLQRRRNGLAVLPGDEIQAVAQQMNNASLDRRFGEDGGNRVREALQAVDDGDQDILDAAGLQLG